MFLRWATHIGKFLDSFILFIIENLTHIAIFYSIIKNVGDQKNIIYKTHNQ